jgi:hypothetical protein
MYFCDGIHHRQISSHDGSGIGTGVPQENVLSEIDDLAIVNGVISAGGLQHGSWIGNNGCFRSQCVKNRECGDSQWQYQRSGQHVQFFWSSIPEHRIMVCHVEDSLNLL